jgi:lauroyl/myristoyl acyltransferase/predicted exporter
VKPPVKLIALFGVTGLLALGVWALATLRLQTELFPLFPQHLPSVQGVQLHHQSFGSAQELVVVIAPPPAGNGAMAGQLAVQLRPELAGLDEVAAVSVIGHSTLEPVIHALGWHIVNLPPETFREFQSLLTEPLSAARLADTRDRLAGAVDPADLARATADPLGLLEWLEPKLGGAIALPDFVGQEQPPVAVLLVRARQALPTFRDNQRFVDRVRSVIETGAGATLAEHVYLTGQPAFVAETSRQMQRDLWVMLLVAVGLVSVVFFAVYRSVGALLWILALQTLSLLTALVVARLWLGELNVISIGFAAVLMGVGIDYCILVYHRHGLGATGDGAWSTLRRGIWFSALTTTSAFGVLWFSSFPGLRQMSVLVAAGLIPCALLATLALPALLRRQPPVAPAGALAASDRLASLLVDRARLIVWSSIVIALASICLAPLWRTYRFYDADLHKLRPAHSRAHHGVELLAQARPARPTLELVLTGRSLEELREKNQRIARAVTGSQAPPPLLLPQDDHLARNRHDWRPGQAASVLAIADREGFDETWVAPTVALLETLDRWAAGDEDFGDARQFFSNVAARPDGERHALVRFPVAEEPAAVTLERLWEQARAAEPSALPANWDILTADLQRAARADFARLSLWALGIVVGLCWWAHGSARLAGLNLLTLALAIIGLGHLLVISRQSMTLMSLLCMPLLVGLVVDYGLHLLLALDQNRGDLRQTCRCLATPILLTGLTSMIGFGALLVSSQPILKNFGLVMNLGIVSAVTVALVVLPALYAAWRPATRRPPALYAAGWFRAGATLARCLPVRLTRRIGRVIGWLYYLSNPRARRTVRRNLSALMPGPVPRRLVRRTFLNFGRTMADYFALGARPRQEALGLVEQSLGLEHVQRARAAGRGALLVTAHLGLFELGGLITEQHKLPLAILTLPEPSRALSRWRAAWRNRWGVTTLEVADGNFGFVEIVRHLKQGALVAMLADRPQDNQSAPVDFPGGQLRFSTGPVWLSLLSGAPIIPISVVALPNGRYRVEAHPPITPEWLPDGREETVAHYTRQLANVFRQPICQHPDQWYQFAPVVS